MKALIAKWRKPYNGSEYTMFLTPSVRRFACWQTIDHLGDPSHAKYKLFDIEDAFDEGVETQDQIKNLYEGNESVKERDFSNYDAYEEY